MMTTPRIIVVQVGARHNYAVPAVFERAGMLEAFYTDMCAGRGAGRMAERIASVVPGNGVRALANRRPPDAVLAKTQTFDFSALEHGLRSLFMHGVKNRYLELSRYGEVFGKRLVSAGTGNATHIYSIFGEGGAFLTEAKRSGLKIVVDVIIALSTEEIVLAEHRAFPDWDEQPLDQRAIMGPDFRRDRIMLEATDLFICPSPFVRDDLVKNHGVDAGNTRIVPYAVAQHWFSVTPRPEPGRLLFAGTADLRKGIHYLAMAAVKLKARRRNYSFRVAGHAGHAVRDQSVCRALTFLGRVLRNDMLNEFARADVMVLPTLAEGSAGVTYEALAAGVPVVTTRAAGSVVRDGVDGLIVPERDPDALAGAIETIVEDRERRNRMAEAARAHARAYTWDRYGPRLIEAAVGD